MCYARAWKQFNVDGKIENAAEQLVVVCGEITHRTVYAKEDLHKENPQLGDLSFSVKEVYPLADALPLVSKGMRLRLRYEDPDLKAKVATIRNAIVRSPGALPVLIELVYPSGRVIDVDLGPAYHVGVTLSFLSELEKVVPQTDVSFRPNELVTLAPKEPKPWER